VADRYLNHQGRKDLEIWKHNRQVQAVSAGCVLRVQAPDPFALHWSNDEWQNPIDFPAQTTAVGIHFVDIAIASEQRAPLRFTFRWTTDGRWEGRDYAVAVRAQ
jgi:glucoamylase